MREIAAAFQELRLYGMAGAWVDLTSQGNVGIESSRWLVEHLLQAEHTDRAMRAVSYQLKSARFEAKVIEGECEKVEGEISPSITKDQAA